VLWSGWGFSVAGERRYLRSADADSANWADCLCSCLRPQQSAGPGGAASTVVTTPTHARRARSSVGDMSTGAAPSHDDDSTPGCLKCLNGRRNVQPSAAQQTVVNPLYPAGAVASPQVAVPPLQPYPQPVAFQMQPYTQSGPSAVPGTAPGAQIEVKDTVNPMWGVPGQVSSPSDPIPQEKH
jgi:hypothetical protein